MIQHMESTKNGKEIILNCEKLERRFALYRRMAELNRDYGVHAAL